MINIRRGCFTRTKELRNRLRDHRVATLAFAAIRLYFTSLRFTEMTTPNMNDNVPGTEYLVDTNHNLDVSHAGSGESDIVLLPQPTACGRDPLVSIRNVLGT